MVCVKAIDVCSAVKTDIVFLSRRAHLDPYELVEKWLYRTFHDRCCRANLWQGHCTVATI
jgi:hypothetical protein